MEANTMSPITQEYPLRCCGERGVRSKFGDWRVMLDRFAALAEAGA